MRKNGSLEGARRANRGGPFLCSRFPGWGALRRRVLFQSLLELFRKRGISESVARPEIRAFIRGEAH